MASSSHSPNILFVVWDACRADYASEFAPNLADLGESNVVFKRAITPANWSLPSHASLFSGEYPSEHGSQRFDDTIDAGPLLDALHEEGYRSYSVSANGFASNRTGFHDAFDESYYTNGEELFQDGLGVYDYGRSLSADGLDLGLEMLKAAIGHRRPVKSLANIGSVIASKAARKSSLLQRIPHPLFAGASGYTYSGAKNNHHIERIFQEEAETESPFFLFSNFMETHRPYLAQGDDMSLSFRRRRYLNEEVANPWRFVERNENDQIDDKELNLVQKLYRNEVRSVDNHLKYLLDALEEYGLRDETLVVVTADHGENLGEVDASGRRRMGHEASMSDHLLRVPLVVGHPDLEPARIETPVSLNALYDLFRDVASGEPETLPIEDVVVPDGPVVSECPANGAKEILNRYPEVPEAIVKERVSEHGVAGYLDDWRVHRYSTGEVHAWRDGDERSINEAPRELVERCESHLESLTRERRDDLELSAEETERLESLGYL